jgi:uncharacterized membrane protein YbhN (UPF0104 family)
MAKKLNLKKWISAILFLVLAGLLVWYVASHWEEIAGLLTLDLRTILLLLGLGLVSAVINCLYHWAILNTFGLKLTLVDWMGVTVVSNAIAFVVPMRGELALAAGYYKRVNGLAYTKSVSIAAGNMVFGVSFSLLEIIAAMLCVGFIDGKWPPLIWGVTAVGVSVIAVIVFVSLASESRLRKWLERWKIVHDVIAGFNALLRSKTLIGQLLLCMTASNIVRLLMMMLCFRATGNPITLYEALLYASLAWLASVIAVVPGNIGLKESILGVATVLMGVDFAVGVTASLLERAAAMIVYIGLALVFAIPVWLRYAKYTNPQRKL